jgi:hypothetical protein
MRRLIMLCVLLVSALIAGSSPAVAHSTDAHYERAAAAAPSEAGEGVAMNPVRNLPHQLFAETNAQNGSDIEFLKVGAKEYALAGTLRNGLQIVDITDPTTPTRAAVYDCPINQGDVQVFRQRERILATYVADSRINTAAAGWETSACVVEANAQGAQIDGSELGTFLVDLTDPTQPSTVSFIEIPEGSHNQTVHPSGDYLYNSNSDLVTTLSIPQITIHDISDPENPRHVQDFTWEPRPGLGSESHDIFFNSNGTRAYVAAVSSTLILNTSDPEDPQIISPQIFDPTMQVAHQSDIISLPREDGSIRDLLVITDEQGGAAATAGCPGGGLHIYDITGDLEKSPAKLGTWFIADTEPLRNPLDVCTSHVLRFYPHQGLMTIAWYTKGVRVVDISGLADLEGSPTQVAYGDGLGMTEVGNYVFEDADTWAFKTNRIEADGSFYGYGNDMARGLDVYRFDGAAAELGRTVPVLEPEDMGAEGCTGVPVATAYVDRDTARDAHERSIDCVISRAIAVGAVQNAKWFYQPLRDVTREQMASFIVSALRAAGVDTEWPQAPAEDKFTDIGQSAHAANINLLAEAGIVSGVGDGKYDPSGLITRAQMATFMVKAAEYSASEPTVGGGQRFTDIAGNTHADNIEVGAETGLFSGVTATEFRPDLSVARDQMASFLTNLLVFRGGPLGPGMPAVGGMPR